MKFNEYQEKARATAIYPEEFDVVYPLIGLSGEVGELANKIQKQIRDSGNVDVPQQQIIGELGDILWYLSTLAGDLGVDMEDVAKYNLTKLASRRMRNKLNGSGDDR